MYSKNKIGNRNVHSKLPIVVFQINSISSIESEEFRETSTSLISIAHLRGCTVRMQNNLDQNHKPSLICFRH